MYGVHWGLTEICGEMTIKPIDVWRLRAWGAVIILWIDKGYSQ